MTDQTIRLPILPGGKVTYKELVEERMDDSDIEKIFNDRRRKHTDLTKGSLRHDIYSQFMELVAKWKPEDYANAAAAEKLPHYLEVHSKTARPTSRTSFCSLIGRMMALVRYNHRHNMTSVRTINKLEQKNLKEIALNKHSAKREIFKQKIGVDTFNAKKHRDKAKSAARKAKEVSDKPARIQKFLEFRQTAQGRSYDKIMAAARLFYPKYDRVGYNQSVKSMGHTSHSTLADFIRAHIAECSNMKIQFDVDPCNFKTVLLKYVAIAGEGPLQLSNTNDIESKGKTFSITAWYIKGNDLYVNLNRQVIRCHRKLPKKWADFEQWTGYGVQGNPQIPLSVHTLIKIVPHNVSFFRFSKGGEVYSIGHTNMVSMQKQLSDLNIPDKYVTAAEDARAAAAAEKRRRAQAARAAEQAKRDRKKYNMLKFPTKDDASKHSLQKMLAQQFAAGSISEEAFKMGMAALG